ncbi:OLC1v1016909C1 [Oldenlandia corymbosa var. corymbosa]|uniref:OLC1v1016909C1 n=1 Tax=Oldenlandia corymbosa var. corymbosa TaxID=529605 RepID=A0AAV1E870_OLDCO|nr:OLC1v1016909C1 [Oldenlandia corymbosa var. corymbosa]
MASEQNSNQHVVQPSFVDEGCNETVGNVVNSFSLPTNHVEVSGPSSPNTVLITNHAESSALISPFPNQAVAASVLIFVVQTNAASVPITAAQRYIADINGLIDTKNIHFFIVARIMTLWKVPESSKNSKIKSMEMTLIDAQGGKIQATVPGRNVKDFQDILKEDLRGHIIAYSDPIVDYGKKRMSVELEDERFKLQVYVRDASGSRIVTLWDRMVYNFINKTAGELGQKEGKDYPKILNEIIGKKCLFRLDVSNFNIRNSNNEISIARLTTEADIIKKYLDDVAEDQTAVSCTDHTDMGLPGDDIAESPPSKNKLPASADIDPEMSAEYYQTLTTNQGSTAKTAISCTDHTDMGLPGDDIAESPPSKNRLPASAGEESVKSKPNKRAKKLIFLGGSEWKKMLSDHADVLEEATTAVLQYDGNMSFTILFSRANGVEIPGSIKIDAPGIRTVFVNIHINKKRRCQLYGYALKRISHRDWYFAHIKDLNLHIGNRFLMKLDENSLNRAVVDKRFFSGTHWPSEHNIAKAVDVKQYNWEFMVYREENEAAGFEGPKWEEFVDYYFNHLKCINVIFIYTGNLNFHLRIFDNKGYYCNLMREDSDTSDGEIDSVAYLRSNGDQNTFSAIMNNTQIQRGNTIAYDQEVECRRFIKCYFVL